MSVQNAERLLRLIAHDQTLCERVQRSGAAGFEAVSAEAGASCSAYDVVQAVAKNLDSHTLETIGSGADARNSSV